MINGSGSYQSGISDLQTLLSDEPNDRYAYLHRCFGPSNGVNLNFKTFYRRRSTDFTTGVSGGVYVNSVLVPASGITSDNVETGEFVLGTAPADGDVVEASYFHQWFDVVELDTFLQVASRWLSSSPDYTQTPAGLVDALLKYAAGEGCLKMAMRWRTYASQEWKVEDAPKNSPTYNTSDFKQMADQYKKDADASRKSYYSTRQDRALAPNFGLIRGNVREMP